MQYERQISTTAIDGCANTSSSLNAINNTDKNLSTPTRLARSLGFDSREFNKFTIRRLKEGHFGVIRKVEDDNTKKTFIVKFPKPRGKEFFEKENRIILQLQEHAQASSYIVKISKMDSSEANFNFDLKPNQVFALLQCSYDAYDFVIEKKGFIINQKPDFSKIIAFVSQVLEAAHFIHTHNVTHRDLTLENILFDARDGRWKLCDFSLAEDRLENLDELKGTLTSLPPEMIKGQTYNSKVDMWNVGCIIYEVITHQYLPDVKYNSKNLVDGEKTKQSRVSAKPISLANLPDNTPEYLISVLKSLLKKHPAKRCTAQEALTSLKSQTVLEEPKNEYTPQQLALRNIIELLLNLIKLILNRVF